MEDYLERGMRRGNWGGDIFYSLFSVVDTQMSIAHRRATLKICILYYLNFGFLNVARVYSFSKLFRVC